MTKTPYADVAPVLAEMGLPAIPLGGEDGKKPAISGFTQRPFGKPAMLGWAKKHAESNVGLITGKRSQLVVVDADNSDTSPYIERFGDTPVKARTPGRDGCTSSTHSTASAAAGWTVVSFVT